MATPTTPPPSSTAQSISQIVGILAQANVAIPIIMSTVTTVIGIVRALRGTAPPLAAIIADIEKQTAENRQRGEAEIARLKALIDDQA